MERMTEEELKKELEKLKDFKLYVFEGDVYVKAEDYKEIAIENKKLKEKIRRLEFDVDAWHQLKLLLEGEIEKLKEENEYRKSIVDIIPEGEGNVAEETIKDLQDRIKELEEENTMKS